jgi:hypothetical protein
MKRSPQLIIVPMALIVAVSATAHAQSNDPGTAHTWSVGTANQALAESIIARAESSSGRALAPGFRAGAVKRLAALSPDALGEIDVAGAGIGIQAYASSGVDLVFVPVTPCRIIDTRLAGGIIAAGATRNFLASGGPFTGQGGSASSCGIPYGPATAVVINFVAVGPAGAGDLRVTPFGSALPVASVINYAAIPGLNIANGINVKICDPAASACPVDIAVQAEVSATHLVADVYGYYELLPPAGRATAVVNAAGVYFDSARTRNFTAVSRPSTGLYCLTPAPSIDPTASPAYVTVEWSSSLGNSLAAFHRSTGTGCAAGQFAVLTFDFTGAASNNVSFEVFIP